MSPLWSLLLLLIVTLYAPLPSCEAVPEASQLDFWLGEWALTWPGGQGGTPEGEDGRGTNTITKALSGCVVYERFTSDEGFEGVSLSAYDPRSGTWRQTWVDNQGGYLLFTGGLRGSVMEFRTAPFTNPQGQTQISRMTWRNATADALDWHWQRSTDGGATWEDVWVIRYARR